MQSIICASTIYSKIPLVVSRFCEWIAQQIMPSGLIARWASLNMNADQWSQGVSKEIPHAFLMMFYNRFVILRVRYLQENLRPRPCLADSEVNTVRLRFEIFL